MSAAPASLVLAVDLTSPVPPYEQVRTQVAAHASAGRVRPGDRLPTVRALAADLGIAVGTVATATGGPGDPARPAAADTLEVLAAADLLVQRARASGWSDEQVLTAVRGALLAPVPARAGVSWS